jgi:hypothetical protein
MNRIALLRIRDVSPGFRILDPIPDPEFKRFRITGSHQLSIFNPKKLFQALGVMIRDVHPGSLFFLSVPDPVVKKAPEPGSATMQDSKKFELFRTLKI